MSTVGAGEVPSFEGSEEGAAKGGFADGSREGVEERIVGDADSLKELHPTSPASVGLFMRGFGAAESDD